MYDMKYKDGYLIWGGVSIEKLAKKYGTPLYIYNKSVLENNFQEIKKNFNKLNPLICFALKSNSNISILKTLATLGAGADTVSGGEIYLALKCGYNPEKIVYSGVGKTEDEIKFALKNKILMLNVESVDELMNIQKIAEQIKEEAPIAVRVNPDIDANTHPFISTGMKKNKFGIDIEKCVNVYKKAVGLKNIRVKGIHMHIGSQILDISPYIDAVDSLFNLYSELKKKGIDIEYFNIGGGFGHGYEGIYESVSDDTDFFEQGLDIYPLAEKINQLFKNNVKLIIEPGRRVSASSGVLVGKVLYKKEKADKTFFITDTGMSELIRPSLYRAFHGIIPVKEINRKVNGDLVGPICESTDFLAQDRELPDMNNGDYFAVLSAGAYGFALSSNYNSRLKPAEVFIENGKVSLIRKRENSEILINNQPEKLDWEKI